MGKMRFELSDMSFLSVSVRTNNSMCGDVKWDLKVDVAVIWKIVGKVVDVIISLLTSKIE